MEFEEVFKNLARNKSLGGPEALAKHNQLVNKLNEQMARKRVRLESAAFADLAAQPTQDPLREVREAIKRGDPLGIKQAALNAYKKGHYAALRLAAEFDQDIAEMVDYLATFGELASINQRVFIRAALSPPKERV